MQDPGYGLPRIPLPRRSVNKGKKKGRSFYAPALARVGDAFLLPWGRPEFLRSISGTEGSQPLHLSLVGRLFRLGWWHC